MREQSECIKREFEKIIPGFMQVCDENERRIRKKRCACKMFLMEGGHL